MATLKVVGSGSQQGNTYIIEAGGEHLLLDLGCKWDDILDGLNRDISNTYALLTHRHSDHSKSIPNALKSQIPVFSNQDVVEKSQGVKALQPKKKYKIGSFVVMPLEVEHNAPNFAYIIEHEEIGKLVFATDLTHFPYKIKNVNHLLIEANNSEDIIIDHLCDNEVIRSMSENHMEINETINAIRNNISSDLNNIILCHLSDGQSNERLFKQLIFEEFGIMPYVAERGLEVSINKEEF